MSVSAIDRAATGDDPVEVGAQLRAVRRRLRLSLQEVESASGGEFRVSSLGAYERGRRAISLSRLQRLAQLYGVTVGHLLIEDDGDGDGGADAEARGGDEGVTLDLTAFLGRPGPELELIRRYVETIQVQRRAFDSRELTVRGDDVRALATIWGTDCEGMTDRLRQLGLVASGDSLRAVR